MSNLPICVLGSQIGTNAGRQIKAELYNWLKLHFDIITVDVDANVKSEYPFIKKVIETAISSNKPVLYIHTKGACNVISKAFELNKKTSVKIPDGALPHDSQIIVRRMWKHEFTTNYSKYLDAVSGNDPVVACPYTGTDKTTWQNAFVINPSAARILQQSFHEDPNRYYYERMFEHTSLKVLGIRLNNVERDKKCQSNMWQDIWDNFFVSHPFNIISNNCFGGLIYKNMHIQYNNPFMFSIVHFSDIAHIFMDSLNWANIQLEHTRGPHNRNSAFDVVVDNHIRIHYVHYLEDMVHDPPIIKDGNVLGKYIYEYVANKYIERVKRMCSMYIQPYYILSWDPSSGELSDINALAIKMNEYRQRYCVVVPPDIDVASLHNIQNSNIIVSPCKKSSTWVKDSVEVLQHDIISRICAADMC